MFKNAQVIVTGSSRGLGKAIAEAFLNEGAMVLGISRSRSIEDPNYTHLEADLSDLEVTKALDLPLQSGLKKYIMINNAGRLGEVNRFDKLEEDDLIKTAHLNYLAPILFIKKFNRFARNGKADFYVINIGSGAAFRPIDGWSMYCSTKSALSMFSRVVKEESELHDLNLKIVDLSPGIIDTAMQAKIRSASEDEFSSVKSFEAYHQNGELQSSLHTADLIIRNFDSLFKNSEGMDSLRNYK
jgi:benzil reductase ((S)-benzoin forming)